MKNLLLIVFMTFFTLQFSFAQQIRQISVDKDGKAMFLNFDCQTMSHAPLQSLVSCNEGHLEELSLKINQEFIRLNDKGNLLSFMSYYFSVEYGTDGRMQKIKDKKSGLLMKFYYEPSGKLSKITEKKTKSNIYIKYNQDGQLSSVTDTRHDLRLKFDYDNNRLCKVHSGKAFTIHHFVYKADHLVKIKQKGMGTIVNLEYQNGHIVGVKDHGNPVNLRVGYGW